jgi:L-aminopeptidase/D-esterase-like protein
VPAMLSRQKPESYGPWQLLPPVKQLMPLWVHVPHQGEVSATLYAAEAQAWQSDWQVGSVGAGVGLVVGLMVGRGVAAAGLAPGTQSLSMRRDAKAKP